MGKVERTRAHLAALDAQIAAARRRMAGLVALGTSSWTQVAKEAEEAIAWSDDELARLAGLVSPPHALGWDHKAWETWTPGDSTPEGDRSRLRIGTHLDDTTGVDLGVADTVGLVGSGRSLLITSRGPEQARRAAALLQSLVARLALMFPEGASFVLLEPAHSGGPLVRMGKALHQVQAATSREQVRVALDQVTARIERISTEHLSSSRPTFEDLPEREQLDLGLQFVVASAFPSRLGEREIEALDVVASDGPEKGTYALVHWDLDEELPITVRRVPMTAATRVDMGGRHATLAGEVRTTVAFDEIGVDAEERLRSIERPDRSARTVSWDDVSRVEPDQVWTHDSRTAISTPLGKGGAGDDDITITFGVDAEGEPVSHGVVAGQTGSGKSGLLHALICGLALRYSPDELGLYLIDGKSGLEFESYRTLPHARVVSLHTAPELARSVLSELEVDMDRRAALFTAAGVSNLADYRAAGGPERRLPRLLCVIDEFQEVFQGGEDEGMRLLTVLTEKGRAYGIHILLASQGFQPSGLRNAGKFYGNVALRIALALDRAVLEAVDLFGGAAGRQLVLDTCTTAGRIMVNDRGGSAQRNRPGRAAYITREQIDRTVADLAARPEAAAHRPVVFHGGQAPRIIDHPLVQGARSASSWPSASQLSDLARRPCSAGGLGHGRWQAAEGPVLVALGRALDVHGQTSAMVRRAASENVVIVGSSEPERLGMLLGAVALMTIVHPPDRLRLAVLDRTFAGSEHATLLTDHLAGMVDGRHHVTAVGPSSDATPGVEDTSAAQAGLVESLAAEVERRIALPEAALAAEPSTILVAHDLDRCDALRQVEERYGPAPSPLGQRFAVVLDSGPAVGVHVISSFGYVTAAKAIVGDTGLNRSFRHRIALQMSDDESFELLRSSAASKLPSAQGEVGLREAVTAVYLDRQSNVAVPFKPYTAFRRTDDEGGLVDDVAAIGALQDGWGVG